MISKKHNGITGPLLTILLIISLGHTGYTLLNNSVDLSEIKNNPISGKSIFTDLKDNYKEIGQNSRYLVLGEWVIVILILIIILIKSQIKHKHDLKIGGSIKKQGILKLKKTKSETDLDLLYEMLKKRKNLSIPTIAKIFKTKKEIALEWCKLLEESNLGQIHYPFLGDPEITAISEVKNEKEKQKEKKK